MWSLSIRLSNWDNLKTIQTQLFITWRQYLRFSCTHYIHIIIIIDLAKYGEHTTWKTIDMLHAKCTVWILIGRKKKRFWFFFCITKGYRHLPFSITTPPCFISSKVLRNMFLFAHFVFILTRVILAMQAFLL